MENTINKKPLEAAGFTQEQASAIIGVISATGRILAKDQKKEFLSRQDLIEEGMPRSTIDALGKSDRFSEFGYTGEGGRKIFIRSKLLRFLELREDDRIAARERRRK